MLLNKILFVMETCRDTSCPDQKKDNNILGLKSLKMCFGKGRLKQRESMERGNTLLIIIYYYYYIFKIVRKYDTRERSTIHRTGENNIVF